MKFLPLILANLRRKKIRTALTVGSFVVALFLFGLLGAIHYGFRQGIDVAGADRLVVIGRTSIIQPLPLPYYERLKRTARREGRRVRDLVRRRLPGPEELLRAVRDRRPTTGCRMYPEFKVDPQEWKAFLADRQGVIVGGRLTAAVRLEGRRPRAAARRPASWAVRRWDFNIRGIYHGTRPNDDETQFWLQARLPGRERARRSGRASSAGTWSASRIPTTRRQSRSRSTRVLRTPRPRRGPRPRRRLPRPS